MPNLCQSGPYSTGYWIICNAHNRHNGHPTAKERAKDGEAKALRGQVSRCPDKACTHEEAVRMHACMLSTGKVLLGSHNNSRRKAQRRIDRQA